jgi:hypothetical protein
MSKYRAHVLVAIAAAFSTFAQAQTLQMGNSENAAIFEQTAKPTRGMTQERVEAEYGSPQSQKPAIGEPPISRWEYANFVVFFEFDRVIHAVSKR